MLDPFLRRCRVGAPSPFVAVAHDDFFDTEDLDLELGYPIAEPARLEIGAGRQLTQRELPAVERMLSVVYVGSQEDGHRRSHHAVALWLDRHDCELCGPGRELIYPRGRDGRETVEIQYPIAARNVRADALGGPT